MWNHLRCCIILVLLVITTAHAQDTTRPFTLTECLQYALKAQPAVRQAGIDEAIARTNNKIALSAGLPQVGLNAGFNHYFQLPTAFVPNTQNPSSDQRIQTTTGLYNTSVPQFSATQALFSNDVLSVLRTAPLYRQQSRENTEVTRINVIAAVSQAFYDVLLSQAQLVVLAEDTARLGRNLHDAYSRYNAGIVDKVDYKRATIALNNSIADLKNARESIGARTAVLKHEMGLLPQQPLTLVFDTVQMMQDISLDTTEALQYERRIEYRQLHTTQRLQHETTAYYATNFLPSISAFYNYVPQFQNNKFSSLFGNVYPYSLFGINLSLPIFQGFRRLENVHRSRLLEERLHWDEVNLQLQINEEYKTALAAYKSNLNSYAALKDNVQLAHEVYDVIKLQYREGIKEYLEVITAESDLRNAEINYLNALYQLLESKVSLQRALGDIPTEI